MPVEFDNIHAEFKAFCEEHDHAGNDEVLCERTLALAAAFLWSKLETPQEKAGH